MVTNEQIEQYETQGYFIADDAVEPGILPALLAAAQRTKARVRAAEVDLFTHRDASGEPWAIRGLFAPEFDEPLFAEYLMSRPVMGYTRIFLGSELSLAATSATARRTSGSACSTRATRTFLGRWRSR
jgi:hypothetical protein